MITTRNLSKLKLLLYEVDLLIAHVMYKYSLFCIIFDRTSFLLRRNAQITFMHCLLHRPYFAYISTQYLHYYIIFV